MGRRKGITPDQDRAMYDMRQKGKTFAQIATVFQISDVTAAAAVKRAAALDVAPEDMPFAPDDSLRVAILKTLDVKGSFADSRSLITFLGRDERWHHAGLHSLHHVLHALLRDNYISAHVDNDGPNVNIQKISITPKGRKVIHPSNGGSTGFVEMDRQPKVEDNGRADHEALREAGIAVAVIPESDAIIDPTGGYVPDEMGDPRPEPPPDQTPAEAVEEFARAVIGYPILRELQAKAEQANTAKAKAEKMMEAAILIEDVDPDMAATLQARAEGMVELFKMTSTEAEYLIYAEAHP